MRACTCFEQLFIILISSDCFRAFLPPANEVWGKVICLQVCICPQGGRLVLGGCLIPGGAWSRGVPGPGGCLVETPRTATAAGGTRPTGMHSC